MRCSVVFGVTLRLLVINISASSPAINKHRCLLPAISVTTCHGPTALFWRWLATHCRRSNAPEEYTTKERKKEGRRRQYSTPAHFEPCIHQIKQLYSNNVVWCCLPCVGLCREISSGALLSTLADDCISPVKYASKSLRSGRRTTGTLAACWQIQTAVSETV